MRVSAVSYLNTWPLVWGFLHGPGAGGTEKGRFDFRFDLPAGCAAAVGAGEADIGLVPCAELDPLGLDYLPNLGIATNGAVRSILLISRCPFERIRTLAADSSSRTSVALARILLAKKYDCRPVVTRHSPDLDSMLREHDAALIIGDPALRLDPATLPYRTLDLGEAWVEWSGLPMVFAVWAGKKAVLTNQVAAAFEASWQYGHGHMEEIASYAAAERGFDRTLALDYLTRHIVFELGEEHRRGLSLFKRLTAELPGLAAAVVKTALNAV